MTSNKDMPAMPTEVMDKKRGSSGVVESFTRIDGGLTKREQFCLTMGVADTGDEELDAIIRKGNEQKFAGLAMSGLATHDRFGVKETSIMAQWAVECAEALLAQLEDKDCE